MNKNNGTRKQEQQSKVQGNKNNRTRVQEKVPVEEQKHRGKKLELDNYSLNGLCRVRTQWNSHLHTKFYFRNNITGKKFHL